MTLALLATVVGGELVLFGDRVSRNVELLRERLSEATGVASPASAPRRAPRPALPLSAGPVAAVELRGLSKVALIRTAARLRPGEDRTVLAHTKLALRCAAGRCEALDAELATLDARLDELTAEAAPELLEHSGVGPGTAGALLVAAGDNPGRLGSEAAFSMLCGASPIEASSGQTKRHRLDRGGDRQANAALFRIVLVRMRWDQRTKDYVERRTKEGKTKKEIMRCLKRYVAREVYAVLKQINEPKLMPEAA